MKPLIYRVTQLDLINGGEAGDMVKVSFFAPMVEGATGDARRSGHHTMIVPLGEAQAFYGIGVEFEMSMTLAPERVSP